MRPGCPSPARASLSFRYADREAWLERLTDEPQPECYDLCSAHAARTQAPHGWDLRDRRPIEEQVDGEPPATPTNLGGEQTVAVLAKALRAVPDAPAASGEPAGRSEDASTSPILGSPPAVPADPGPADPGPADPVPTDRVPPDHEPGGLGASVPVPAAPPRAVPAARDRRADEPVPDGPARHW